MFYKSIRYRLYIGDILDRKNLETCVIEFLKTYVYIQH